MSATAQKAFSDLIAGAVAPLLEKRGFARAGLTFHRRNGKNYAVIAFQKSTKSSAKTVLFTATLGAWSRRVALFFEDGADSQTPSIAECHWTRRLGELLPVPSDHWWPVAGADGSIARSEALEVLQGVGLSLAERMSNDEELRDLWMGGSGPGITAIQRLMYLSILVRDIGPPDALASVVAELERRSAGRPVAREVRAHLARLAHRPILTE